MTSFRDLHVPGAPFVLGNVWDRGTARLLAALGAPALATSSAAHAFTLGVPDGGSVGRDEALAHAADIAAATVLPVSADLENGYGHTPQEVADTVSAAARAGLAGCCIEDTALPGSTPYPPADAVDRVEAGAAVARAERAGGADIFFVARADGLMLGHYDLAEAVARVKAFAAAGADGVYVPLLPDLDAVRQVCAAVSVPVNVLAVGPLARFSVADLGAVGAARISLGSTLARATHQVVLEAARGIYGDGSFAALHKLASGEVVDGLLRRGSR
jgi:2-methylisocitrate lyase-like PEP mutase family enzyme